MPDFTALHSVPQYAGCPLTIRSPERSPKRSKKRKPRGCQNMDADASLPRIVRVRIPLFPSDLEGRRGVRCPLCCRLARFSSRRNDYLATRTPATPTATAAAAVAPTSVITREKSHLVAPVHKLSHLCEGTN